MELALQDTHLVAEDNKLDVLVYVAAPTRDNEGQDTAEPGVHEREGHHPKLTGSGAECQLRALIGILVPFSFAAQHDGRRGGWVVLFTSGQYHGAMPSELPFMGFR